MELLKILLVLSIYFNSLLCEDNKNVIQTNNPNNITSAINNNKTISDKNSNSTTNNNNGTVADKTQTVVNVTIPTTSDENSKVEIVAIPSKNDYDANTIPGGFFIFMSLGFIVIVVIVYKIYRGRFSRAERRYGVQGQHGTQELTPLPLGIEDDSDNDDQTLFDIHQQLQARDNFVL